MSSNSFSYSSSSVSYSTSTSSSTTRNGQTSTTTDGARYMAYTTSDPSGTTTHTATQHARGPVYTQRRDYDASGRLVASLSSSGDVDANRRIEDVTDEQQKPQQKQQQTENDKLYEERMEDEYAKKEGGNNFFIYSPTSKNSEESMQLLAFLTVARIIVGKASQQFGSVYLVSVHYMAHCLQLPFNGVPSPPASTHISRRMQMCVEDRRQKSRSLSKGAPQAWRSACVQFILSDPVAFPGTVGFGRPKAAEGNIKYIAEPRDVHPSCEARRAREKGVLLHLQLIPLVPLMFAVYGYVTCIRGRTNEGMEGMLQQQKNVDFSSWELRSGERHVLPPLTAMYWYACVKKAQQEGLEEQE
ncbi:hypothetical protein F4809DRAFT_665222 [Biscogniauxia mediterranea]|nr:hypothetical protein F4809DRAFT_665222 [Biscogniauxia mediterranea]